jgi:1-acyl-sn-glycerol-3-phosphate acyltransferase
MQKRRATLSLPRVAGKLVLGCARYGLALITLVVCAFVFHVFNRTRIHGRAFWRLQPNLMIVSNHQSLIDSFVIASTLAFPQFFVMPWLLPWHLPERRNFFASRGMRFVMLLWKAIPVDRAVADRTKNIATYRHILGALRYGTVHIFLEGTRSKDERLLPPKPAVAKLLLETGASVLLVGLNGMHRIQPHRQSFEDQPRSFLHLIGRRFAWIFHFRTGHQADVIFDDGIIGPQELSRLAGNGTDAERWERLATALAERIVMLKASAYPTVCAA